MKDEDFDLFFSTIYQIFNKNNLGCNKQANREWFDKILKELEVFGLVYIDSKHTEPEEHSIKLQQGKDKNIVSISCFLMLDLKYGFQRSLLSLYPSHLNWSHTGVYLLIKNLINNEIYLRFFNDLSLDKQILIDIRRFCNMVFGLVNVTDLKICNFNRNKIINQTSTIFREYFSYNQVILLDTDRVLLRTTLKDYRLKNRCHLHELGPVHVVGCSDYSSGLSELNKFCRKFKIDILP